MATCCCSCIGWGIVCAGTICCVARGRACCICGITSCCNGGCKDLENIKNPWHIAVQSRMKTSCKCFNHSTWIKTCTSNLSIPRSVLFLDSWTLKPQDKLILGAYTQEQTPSDRIPADCLWLILRSDLVNIKLHYLSSFQTTRKHPLRCLWDLWGDFAVSWSGRWVLRT